MALETAHVTVGRVFEHTLGVAVGVRREVGVLAVESLGEPSERVVGIAVAAQTGFPIGHTGYLSWIVFLNHGNSEPGNIGLRYFIISILRLSPI